MFRFDDREVTYFSNFFNNSNVKQAKARLVKL